MTFKPLPFVLKTLTPEMEKKATLELGETPEVKQNSLEELKRLIRKKTGFEPFMDNIFLLSFLRWKKFHIEKAFQALCNFYYLKEKYSGVYFDIKPSKLIHVLQMNHLTNQPLRDPDGCNVGILRPGYHDLKVATPEELYATIMCMWLATSEMEAFQICGAVLISDWKDLSYETFKVLANPRRIYFAIEVLRCLPSRVKSIHMVNVPSFFNIFYNLIKILLPQKILKRVFVHTSDLTEFHKLVPPEILPEELGGTLGPINNNKHYIPFFLNKEHYIDQVNKGGIEVKH
ncbi:alpha-tocopherol transfer protein-like [Stegodyphus dumicola]|uniref:alpha-tocopherol transfer protein-like n=1 Tax=Stegodyphus dumicola TaxID=202533 RepID=UPI0015B2CB0C|nr:alpha-tocopherol transfer protein-like [Stegodyphus dumicola]XP_035215304.1 alpha-tocopherol transfer protein-like [Stegodyphus dumicola]